MTQAPHATPDTTDAPPAVDPVLYEPPTVTINGREYPMRRLGLKDGFKAAAIFQKGLTGIRAAGGVADGAELVAIILGALVDEETAVTDFLASSIKVSRQDLQNPELFPITAIFDIIDALVKHEDLRSFLARSQALTASAQAAAEPQAD